MEYTSDEIKTSIDVFSKYLSGEEYDESSDLEIHSEKISNYIFELIIENDIIGSEDIVKYINQQQDLAVNGFICFIDGVLLRQNSYNEFKNHITEKSFQLFFSKLDLTDCSISFRNYEDYEFYNSLTKLSNTYCEMIIVIGPVEKSYCIRIPIKNEINFLINCYKRNFVNFLFDKLKRNDFLEYFEEVCSITDFSDEYL